MNRGPQRGVALIQAMLVVTLATSVAVSMVSRQQFDIRRTGNMLQAEQAGLYADGITAWAAQLLRRDRENNQVDHNEEEWASMLPPIPVEGGSIGGHIEDLQGRFNLNSLVVAGKHDTKAVERFRRLLMALELSLDLAMVVADWIDTDLEPGYPGGAEDDRYMSRERPYRSANGPMLSSSELLLLEGMDAEIYEKLRPHVATLPAGTKLNVNTASAPVLMSLTKALSPADADALIEGRGDEGYGKVDDFLSHDVLAGQELEVDILAVQSDHFLIVSQVQFGELSQQRYSVLQRDQKGSSRILMRAQGTY
ncbi:MAG: type II secretion system minor pseudopilin GspK [Pseudomonadota bacterium]